MLSEDVQKVSIRQTMMQRRASLSSDQVASLSVAIADRFLDVPELEQIESIALYAPIRNEVETKGLFSHLSSQKRVLYPRVKGERLEFVPVRSLADLSQGSYGVLEPEEGDQEDLGEIGAVVLPGVAFDLRGERIGFGKGFYDRTLAHYRGVKIGLGYDFQVLPEIPRDDHDVFCHLVITEKRTVRNPAS